MSRLDIHIAGLATRELVAVLILAGVLVVLGTGVVRLLLLDRSLDAVALVRAQAGDTTPLLVEQLIRIDGQLSVALQEPGPRALYDHRRWFSDGRRWVSLPVEARDLPGEPIEEHHQIVVASASLVPLLSDIGRLGLVYLIVSAMLALTFRQRLRRVMKDALLPLRLATESAQKLADIPAVELRGQRLKGEGPDEVGRFVGVVNHLLFRLEEVLASTRRFTGNAAHELRTPLTALRGVTEVALRRPRTVDALRETLEKVHAHALNLATIVDMLLTLARLDAGVAGSERERYRAVDLLDEALQRGGFRRAAAIVGEADAVVAVDTALVQIALDNLIKNAQVHGGGVSAGGLEVDRASVRFIIEDSGPGPDEALIPFERFSRGPGQLRAGGLGLGLALVAEIARFHGGEVLLEHRPEGGARAIFALPRSSGALR